MPGSIVHLAIAENVYRAICNINNSEEYYNKFIIGNLLPNVINEKDKYYSHCWDMDMYKSVFREPIMSIFYDRYNISSVKDMFDNPLLLGYFCHLSSDMLFIREYWEKHFIFYDEKMNVTRLLAEAAYAKVDYSNRIYPKSEFLSNKQYYGDYDILWHYIKEEYHVNDLKKEYSELLLSLDNYDVDINKYDRMISNKEEFDKDKVCNVLDVKLIEEYISKTIGELTSIILKELHQ